MKSRGLSRVMQVTYRDFTSTESESGTCDVFRADRSLYLEFFVALGHYFVVLDAPPVGDPAITGNRLIRTTNVIATVRPRVVFVGPMSPEERRTLEARLGTVPRVHLGDIEVTKAYFGIPDEFRRQLLSQSEEELSHLLWERGATRTTKSDDLVCLESREPLTDVAIANLALAMGARRGRGGLAWLSAKGLEAGSDGWRGV